MFRPNFLGHLTSRSQGVTRCEISAEIDNVASISASFSTKSTDLLFLEKLDYSAPLLYKPIFIPSKEILSIFPGFSLALENKDFNFDETYLNIAKNMTGVTLKGPKLAETKDIRNQLEQLIGGDIVLENNIFYLRSSKNSGKLEAHLMAEGSRKLAMLLYLLKTGELTKGCTFFWDEPETNLNPRFLKKLAELFVFLSKTIQIFIATHSLFLLRELDILKAKETDIKIHFFLD